MRILVIKLGALGDVIRTLPLAKAIKNKFPEAELHWITKKNALDVFEGFPYVDKVFSIPVEITEKYDILYNFDIEGEATELASSVSADKKLGFYSEGGYAASFNFGSEYYLNTLFDDETKKSNMKTYQEMMFEVAELPYNKEHCNIYLGEKDKEYGKAFLEKEEMVGSNIIGIHMGASPRWPSKVWGRQRVKEFIMKARDKGYEVILFGGPNEIEEHGELSEELERAGVKIHRNNPSNTLREFFSLVALCNFMICSDSLALHTSIALERKTIGLFFCTPPHEVEGYGLLKKISAQRLEEFFPEKMDQYDEDLVNSISADQVLASL